MNDKVKIMDIVKLKEPKSTKVYQIKYKENNKTKIKEVVKSLDIAKILIYHKTQKAFILTRQFRALVYINHPQSAIRYELCGGRADKNIPIEEIAKEEVLEEVGYKIDKLEKITTLTTTSKMHLFYTEVDENNKISSGGGIDDENIDVIYIPIEKAKEFMFDESKPKRPALMFCFCWWFHMKEK